MQVGWLWPNFDSIDLRVMNINTLRGNNKTQENELINAKKALFHVSIETLFSKSLQNGSNMGGMIFKRFAINKDIIEVDNNKLTNVRAKDIIYKTHKSTRCFR